MCHYVQAKQNVFRDSLARSKKSSAGAAANLISVGNVSIDEMIAKLVSRMDVCREKIDVCDVNVNTEQIKSKLEVFSTDKLHFCCYQFINLIASGP